jgi:serine/threonine protein kinase
MESKETEQSAAREALVTEALDLLERSGLAALEDFYRQHPEEAPTLRARVSWLIEAGLVEPAPARPAGVPEQLGDFRLRDTLGQGGMGVVYVAEQISLGREVALKLVRPEQLYFPGALQRFRHEVQTIAGLAHPGIVPIYAVGEEQGIPFFAMERVRGASLGAILAELGENSPQTLDGRDLLAALGRSGADAAEEPSPLFDGDWPTVCARIVREVGEALEHAHRRGVLHRDVKPSNIMLTRGGRVMLLDFGLASSEQRSERHTRTGHRVGTIAYMPPEQLRGERELDVRADVYALGVTLYELLALRLPHDPVTKAKRLGRDVPPASNGLRKLDARISWELETVVQTAMEPDPARRYASAAALASDLGRVLEKRPIEARRSSLFLRSKRWIERHPAAALASLLVVLAPSLLAWQQYRAKRLVERKNIEVSQANVALGRALAEVGEQRDAANEARDRAQRHFDRAFGAVETMLSRVGGELLEDFPRMEPIRRELLEEALRLMQELEREPESGPEQERQLARSLRRSAAIHAELGELAEALHALEREEVVLDGLLTSDASADLSVERANLDRRKALVLRLQNDLGEAEVVARSAVARLEGLAGDQPELVIWPLFEARGELAQVLNRLGRTQESRELLRGAIAQLQAAGVSAVGTWEERRELARGLHTLAATPQVYVAGQVREFEPEEAMEILEQALELLRALEAERPGYPPIEWNLAEVLIELGVLHSKQQQFDTGYDLLREAYDYCEGLAKAFVLRPVYAEGLATSALNLSIAAQASGRIEERERWLLVAVENFERLLAADPTNSSHALKLCLALGQLGHTALGNGAAANPERAEELLRRAVELGTPLLEHSPDRESLRPALLWANGMLGVAELQLGKAEDLAESALRAMDYAPRPIELVWSATHLVQAVELGLQGDPELPEETLEFWREEALNRLERAADLAGTDAQVRRELLDPLLAPLASDARFQELLQRLGLQPPR